MRRRARAARRASRVDVVGSRAVRVSVVVPLASAASSSMRLLMLFEPGSATTPSACTARAAAASSCAGIAHRTVSARRPRACTLPCVPRAPRVARRGEQRLQRRAVAGRDQRRAITSSAPRYAVDLVEQRIAVGERDVAPHLRRAAGDAREVAKAARRVREIARRRRAAPRARRQREREQVRQVRDGGEDRDRGVAGRACATRAPQASHSAATRRDRVGVGLRRAASGSTLRSSKQRRRTPPRRRSARCRRSDAPGTNRGSASPRCARAAAITSCFVLPASVTIVRGPSAPADRREQRGNCATGVATSTTSASAQLARPRLRRA